MSEPNSANRSRPPAAPRGGWARWAMLLPHVGSTALYGSHDGGLDGPHRERSHDADRGLPPGLPPREPRDRLGRSLPPGAEALRVLRLCLLRPLRRLRRRLLQRLYDSGVVISGSRFGHIGRNHFDVSGNETFLEFRRIRQIVGNDQTSSDCNCIKITDAL